MGCFSYICHKCNKHIYSDKYGNCEGEEVRLARLVKGKVLETMQGRYDSYGRVHLSKDSKHFIEGKEVPPTSVEKVAKHFDWSIGWDKMCDEMFNNDKHTGMIAIHESCWDGEWGDVPSKDDPNQGWE